MKKPIIIIAIVVFVLGLCIRFGPPVGLKTMGLHPNHESPECKLAGAETILKKWLL
jgi:hypothetical protein